MRVCTCWWRQARAAVRVDVRFKIVILSEEGRQDAKKGVAHRSAQRVRLDLDLRSAPTPGRSGASLTSVAKFDWKRRDRLLGSFAASHVKGYNRCRIALYGPA
jgi:hypothetical protein